MKTTSPDSTAAKPDHYSLTSLSSFAEIYVFHSRLCAVQPKTITQGLDHLLDFYDLIWSVDLYLLATQALAAGGPAAAETICTMIANARTRTYQRNATGGIEAPQELTDFERLSPCLGLDKSLSYYLQLPNEHPEYAHMEQCVYEHLESQRTLFVECLHAWFF